MISIEIKKKFVIWKIKDLQDSVDKRVQRLKEMGVESGDFYIARMKEIQQTMGEINVWNDIRQAMCEHNNLKIEHDSTDTKYFVCADCGYSDWDVTDHTPLQKVTTSCETCGNYTCMLIDNEVAGQCSAEADLDLMLVTSSGIDCVFWCGCTTNERIDDK